MCIQFCLHPLNFLGPSSSSTSLLPIFLCLVSTCAYILGKTFISFTYIFIAYVTLLVFTEISFGIWDAWYPHQEIQVDAEEGLGILGRWLCLCRDSESLRMWTFLSHWVSAYQRV